MANRPMPQRLLALFQNYPEAVRKVIAETLEDEQESLSMRNPRGILEKIEDIIDKVVKNEARQH